MSRYPILKQLLYMIITSIVIVFLMYYVLKIYSRHGKEYQVPDITGVLLENLDTVQKTDYFNYVIIDSVFLSGKQGGEILTQDPLPNSKVKKGRKIYITITASNPENVPVPNLVDLTVRQAISQLDAAGLEGGKLTFVEDMARNAILKQTFKGEIILPNEKIMKGSMIDLVVGRGNTTQNTSVPFVLGKTPEEARRDILASSLNVGKEVYEAGAKRTESRVYKQSPSSSGRTSLGLGAKVDLWYRSEKTTDFDKVIKNYKEVPDTTQIQEETTETDW